MRKSFVIISGILTLVHLICAAVRLFHAWLSLCRTIVYLSIVYTLGQVVLAVSAIHDITDTNKDGTPDNMTFHVWAQRTPTRDTRPSGWLVLTLCARFNLSERCPWWGCSSSRWVPGASNPAWPLSEETSLKITRLLKKKKKVFLTQTLKSEDKDPAELIHRSLTSNIFSFSYLLLLIFRSNLIFLVRVCRWKKK